jgi:phosphonate transport system substrate-binding protein
VKLRLISYLAPNLFWFYEAVGSFLGRVLQVETQVVQSQLDPLEDPLLLQDQLDMAFICGLPFARYQRINAKQLAILVAPVMAETRYQNRPLYFSDVIVQATGGLTTFEDLAGKTFCYNDLGSNSGYNLLRQRLIQSRLPHRFFGKVIPSGSHQRSIQWVAEGLADCAAIDSTVLEQELRDIPELMTKLRVIESIGPCPIPPIVVAQRLGSEVIDQLRSALLQPDITLRMAMAKAHVKCFVAVEAKDYAPLVQAYAVALAQGYETLS